jgi:hypothetical protein
LRLHEGLALDPQWTLRTEWAPGAAYQRPEIEHGPVDLQAVPTAHQTKPERLRRALEQDFSEDDLVGCPVQLAPGEGAPASLEPAEELLTQPGNVLDYLGHEFT